MEQEIERDSRVTQLRDRMRTLTEKAKKETREKIEKMWRENTERKCI